MHSDFRSKLVKMDSEKEAALETILQVYVGYWPENFRRITVCIDYSNVLTG